MRTAAKQCNPSNADKFFRYQTEDEAVDLCYDCPLMTPCREVARDKGELYGVWGGETGEERRAWLVEHHPDPAVRAEAQEETDRLERQRELIRVSKARKRARVRAEKAGEPVPEVVSVPERGSPSLLQNQAKARARRARELAEGGMSLHLIAAELGTSKRTIDRYLTAKYDNIAA